MANLVQGFGFTLSGTDGSHHIFSRPDIPKLEACSGFGDTPDEALHEVQKAKSLWIEAAKLEGKPIPSPKYRPVIYQAQSA
jgi:predicted RNase H-like HicB family nuclease